MDWWWNNCAANESLESKQSQRRSSTVKCVVFLNSDCVELERQKGSQKTAVETRTKYKATAMSAHVDVTDYTDNTKDEVADHEREDDRKHT